jgi:osmotically inducible protein OsmC
MIVNTGSAHWSGGLKDGAGTLSTKSGAIKDLSYNFAKRFEGAAGTNPEELIGAAHASCYAMQLSAFLDGAGMKAESLDASSTVHLDLSSGKPVWDHIHLTVTARVANPDEARFQELAEKAKAECPISKLLAPGVKITLEASLA